MGRFKKPIAYVAFALMATFIFLHVSFPAQIVRQHLEDMAGQRYPSMSLKISDLKPSFPWGIRLEKIRLTKNRNPSVFLFEADSFLIVPSRKILFTGRPAVGFDCRAYGGFIEGFTVFENFYLGPPFRTNIYLKDVHIERYTILKDRLNRDCSGNMNGTVFYALSGDHPIQATGRGEFSIMNGSIRFAEPFLGLSSFDFVEIQIDVELKEQKLVVKRASFKGPQITGQGTGTISLNRAFRRSGLDLTVDVKPVPSFLDQNRELVDAARMFLNRSDGDQFTVKIQGTIAQPRASFM